MTTTQPTTAIAEYNSIATALASVEKYRGLVCDVTTEKGMAEAKAAQREVGALRIALEKTRKKVKEDVIARGKLIDGEANRIFALIAAIEDPIKKQIDAEEERAERARQAAIEAEARRLAEEEAARKRAEEERLAAERRKLEAERAKFEAEQRAAREKSEAEERERRRRLDEEEAARRKALQEEEDRRRAAARAEEERLAAERRAVEEAARKQRAEDEARLRAEREREAEAARAQAEEERKEREKREAAEREARLREAERLDSRQMLEIFCERYGHIHPELADTIRRYLAGDVKLAA